MNGQELVAQVREDEATALSRLGSDKYLIAATGADLATGPVLRSVAAWTAAGRDAFDAWAAESDGSGDTAAAFSAAAERERDCYERVVAAFPEGESPDPVGPDADPVAAAVGAALSASDGTPARVGAGLVGRSLVADRVLLQVVSFFVNEADAGRADLARDLRGEADASLETGTELLEAVCTSDDDWTDARRAAGRVVADAYDEYATALESMGVDPKPVC